MNDQQSVEYGLQNIALPTDANEKQEFDANWRTLCAYLRDMKLLNRGELNPTRWKALCCHLLSHVHKMSGPDLQKLVECENAIEGVKLTIKLLHREQNVLETLQSVGQKIYTENAKQSDKSMKMEVIKRIQKDLGQDQSSLYRERLNKYDQGVDHEKLNEKRKKEEEKEEEFWKAQLEGK
jgi:ATP-dependent Lon protease